MREGQRPLAPDIIDGVYGDDFTVWTSSTFYVVALGCPRGQVAQSVC